jgi:prepilin-type N-terminal cleavage/methylation domain-containing protein
MKLMKNSPHRQVTSSGFTLIELVITIIIVAITSIPISLMLLQYMEGLFSEENLTYSSQLIRLETERITNYYCGAKYDDLAAGTYTPDNIISLSDFWDPAGRDYPRKVEIEVTYEGGDANSDESLKRITVRVFDYNNDLIDKGVTFLARNTY